MSRSGCNHSPRLAGHHWRGRWKLTPSYVDRLSSQAQVRGCWDISMPTPSWRQPFCAFIWSAQPESHSAERPVKQFPARHGGSDDQQPDHQRRGPAAGVEHRRPDPHPQRRQPPSPGRPERTRSAAAAARQRAAVRRPARRTRGDQDPRHPRRRRRGRVRRGRAGAEAGPRPRFSGAWPPGPAARALAAGAEPDTVDGPLIALELMSADPVDQLVPRVHLARHRGQRHQDPPLGRVSSASWPRAVTSRCASSMTSTAPAVAGIPLSGGRQAAAQHRLDPQHQFPRAKRLGHLVIGAQFSPAISSPGPRCAAGARLHRVTMTPSPRGHGHWVHWQGKHGS